MGSQTRRRVGLCPRSCLAVLAMGANEGNNVSLLRARGRSYYPPSCNFVSWAQTSIGPLSAPLRSSAFAGRRPSLRASPCAGSRAAMKSCSRTTAVRSTKRRTSADRCWRKRNCCGRRHRGRQTRCTVEAAGEASHPAEVSYRLKRTSARERGRHQRVAVANGWAEARATMALNSSADGNFS